MNDNIMPKWSDFADPKDSHMEGRKASQDEYLNKPLIAKGFKVMASKRNEEAECLCLQVNLENEDRIIFTGSGVLLKQCRLYESHMPFRGRIIKVDKYLTFAD